MPQRKTNRMTATGEKLVEMPERNKPRGPQPPDSSPVSARTKIPQGSVIEQNQVAMFARFRRNTPLRSIAAQFQTGQDETQVIINQMIDRFLETRRRAA